MSAPANHDEDAFAPPVPALRCAGRGLRPRAMPRQSFVWGWAGLLFAGLVLLPGLCRGQSNGTQAVSGGEVGLYGGGLNGQNGRNEARAITWSELGAQAGARLSASKGGLGAEVGTEGVRFHCAFQKLDGLATAQGLWLTSTAGSAPGDAPFRLRATAWGRGGEVLSSGERSEFAAASGPVSLTTVTSSGASAIADGVFTSSRTTSRHFGLCSLPEAGVLSVLAGQNTLRWVRPGLVEEYSVSIDGVRQDFVVPQAPPANLGNSANSPNSVGPLEIQLSLSGAAAQAAPNGARLVLPGSGRVLAYTRLRVTDATGRELPASLRVCDAQRLTIEVDDSDAAYPVRIDPTFSDANWVAFGSNAGPNAPINAVAVNASAGLLYVGGTFQVIGNVQVIGNAPALGVAMWDGTHWSALGTGVSGVNALALDSAGNLYAGGSFVAAGGVVVNNVAKWNGASWSGFGSGLNAGVNNVVDALAVDSSGNLYAGGSFTTAGGASAASVAKWNGSAWSALGTGIGGTVSSLAVTSGGVLYVGGQFSRAGTVFANGVAQWSGSAWSAVGTGFSGTAYALALDSSGNLYVGSNGVYKWSGTAWSSFIGVSGSVLALGFDGSGNLYAGGNFTASVKGGFAQNLALWNGSAWNAIGLGEITGSVNALGIAPSGNVVIGGQFGNVDRAAHTFLAQWNGTAWSAMATGADGNIYAIVPDSAGGLYIGGSFDTCPDGSSAANLAHWNGSAWSPLGVGVNGVVNALALDSAGNLYAGGNYNRAGGQAIGKLAQWNGSTWNALGAGVDSTVYALLFDSAGNLYAGGAFANAGGSPAAAVAVWNGAAWSPLGAGVAGTVNALMLDASGNLYAGGTFSTAGSVSAANIAQWNGSAWNALGAGVNDTVNALAIDPSGNLYAGGTFNTAGSVSAPYIALWSGGAWSAVGTAAFNNSVNALATDAAGNLYAGGQFNATSGYNRIAQWNGTTWNTLGSGVNSNVAALAMNSQGVLWLGGVFSLVGSTPTGHVAQAMGLVAPSAVTQAPTQVTSAVAQLNGLASATGYSTTVTFDFGTDTNYGTSITAQPAAITGTTATAVSAPVSGLSPLTTYHYRVHAVNGSGVTLGLDQTFTTPNNDATLSGLGLSSGALSPSFATATTTYTTSISTGGANFTLTPTTHDSNATVQVNGVAVISGQACAAISLSPGANALTVLVTAQDGVTQMTYTVGVSYTAPRLVFDLPLGGSVASGGGPINVGALSDTSTLTLNYTLANTGNASLTIQSATFSGPNAGDFTVTAPSSPIAANGTASLPVKFAPTGNGSEGATLTIVSSDPATPSYTIAFSGMGYYTIDQWRQANFGTPNNTGLASDTACPAGDGIPNLLKYATNMAPNVPGVVPGAISTGPGGVLQYTYTRSKAALAAGITFAVQWTDSLNPANWTNNNVTESAVDQGLTELVTATVPAPTGAARFVRLMVTDP